MLRKYLKDVIQSFFKESFAQQTKQTSVKDAKFSVRHTKSMIKPETLAIVANNERRERKSSAESLRLARVFEDVLKKFVNPKLDLITTLEQIKAMEASRREEVLKSLGRILKLKTRSRLPALPPADSSPISDMKTTPEEFSVGWSGQPTVNKITSRVETSAPRGIDHAFLKFSEFENIDELRSAKGKPKKVRLRKSRSRSSKRDRLRKKTSQEPSVNPERAKVYTNDSKGVVDVNVQSLNYEQSTPDVKAQNFQDSKDLHLVRDVKGQNIQKSDLDKEPTELEKLGNLADAKYKIVRDKSREICRQLKNEMEDTVRGFLRSKNKNHFDNDPYASGGNSYISERRDGLQSNTRNQQFTTGDETKPLVGGRNREEVTQKDEKQDNMFYKTNATDEVNINEKDLQVEHQDYPGREVNDFSNLNSIRSSTSKSEISTQFAIPRNLVDHVPGASTVRNRDQSQSEEIETENFTRTSPSDLMKVPVKSIFTSIETNDPISYRNKYKYEKSLSKQKVADRDGFNELNSKQNKLFKKKVKPPSYTVKTKTAFEGRKNKAIKSKAKKIVSRKKEGLKEEGSIDYKKEKTVDLETKSENHPQEERKVKTPRRLYSRSSLLKLRNKKLITFTNDLKRKVGTKGHHKKPGEKKESNKNNKLSNTAKAQERVKDLEAKSFNFKAGDYTPRSKHFLKEKFPLVERMNLSRRELSKTLSSKNLPKLVDIKNNFDQKNSSLKDEVISPAESRRPRTTFTVKAKKRTKVISNSIPSLTVLRQKSASFKESLKTSLNQSINKLSGSSKLKITNTVPLKTEKLDKSKKYTTVNEPNTDKKKNKGYTLKVGKVRNTRPKKKAEAKTMLRMYGIGKANVFFNSPRPQVQNTNSIKQGKLKGEAKAPTNDLNLNKRSLTKTSSEKMRKRLPVTNVQRRSFSTTIYSNSRTANEPRYRSQSAKTSISAPVISRCKPCQGEIVKKIVETNLKTRKSYTSDSPLAEKDIPTKEKNHQHKYLITINEGAYARGSDKKLTSMPVLASPERGKKVKRTTRRVKVQKKRSNIVTFKNDKPVSTSRTPANLFKKKNLDLEVLYNNSYKKKGIDSETNIHLTSYSKNLPNKQVNNKSFIYSTQENNEEKVYPQMIQNVVNKARSLKVIISPTADIDEDQKQRMWKSKEHRLHTLQLYKMPNRFGNLNHQLVTKAGTKNNRGERNEHVADIKIVSKVCTLDANMDRLIRKIKKYKLPHDDQTDVSKSHISNADKNKIISGDDITISANNDGNISGKGLRNHNQKEILFDTQGKMNFALLRLEELVKSQVSKTLNGKNIQSSSEKFGKKVKSSAAGHKDATSKGRNQQPRLYDLKAKSSSKDKFDLENDIKTVLVKLVDNAKKAELSNSKSQLQTSYVKNHQHLVKPLSEDNKSLKSLLKYYNAKTSKKNENPYVTRLVKIKKIVTNLSPTKQKELPMQINELLESNRVQDTKKNAADKLFTDKNPSVSKINSDNLISKVFSRVSAKQFLNVSSKSNSKAQNIINDANNITHIKTKPICNLKISKSCDSQVKSDNSTASRKIYTLGGNNYLSKMKSDTYVNKNSASFKIFKNSLYKCTSKQKAMQQGSFFKPTGTVKNLFVEYDKNIPTEKKLLNISSNQADFKKISPKLMSDPSTCATEITNSTKCMNSTSEPLTLEKLKNESQRQTLHNTSRSCKITKEPCTSLVGKKSVVALLSKYTEDNAFLNRSVPEKLNSNLKSVATECQNLLSNKSQDKICNKFEIPKVLHKRQRLTLSNISKDVAMKRDGCNAQFNPIKCNVEERAGSTDRNKMINEKPSTAIHGILQKETKNDSKIIREVKSGKGAELSRHSSSLAISDKLKRQERRNQDYVSQKRHQIEQVHSFHTPSLKVDKIKKECNTKSVMNRPAVSESKPRDVTIHNQQKAQQNFENAGNRETKLTRQKTFVVTGKKPAKIETQENVLSYDKNVNSGTSWDASLCLEPGFI